MDDKNLKNRRLMESLKINDQNIKVVFSNENGLGELPLEMGLILSKEGDKKVITVTLDSKLTTTEASFMGAVYMDTLNILMKVKESFDSGEGYQGLHILSREEYKQYLIKVKDLKIED